MAKVQYRRSCFIVEEDNFDIKKIYAHCLDACLIKDQIVIFMERLVINLENLQ